MASGFNRFFGASLIAIAAAAASLSSASAANADRFLGGPTGAVKTDKGDP